MWKAGFDRGDIHFASLAATGVTKSKLDVIVSGLASGLAAGTVIGATIASASAPAYYAYPPPAYAAASYDGYPPDFQSWNRPQIARLADAGAPVYFDRIGLGLKVENLKTRANAGLTVYTPDLDTGHRGARKMRGEVTD